MTRTADMQYAWRGWILALLFAVLAIARYRSGEDVRPGWLVLVLIGAGYRLYAGRFMPGHSNAMRMSGEALALAGPYRIGRHPLYLANLFTAGGLILFANCLPAWGAASLFLAVFVHHDLLARAEERFLAGSRGEDYAGYLRSTRRWVGGARKAVAAMSPMAADAADVAGGGGRGAAPVAGFGQAWARQAANLGKAGAAVLILWGLAGLRP
jgi:protein-S-isoprenylcysteine O-methyltransferase Ste14